MYHSGYLMGASFDCDEDVFPGAHAEVFSIVEHVGGVGLRPRVVMSMRRCRGDGKELSR